MYQPPLHCSFLAFGFRVVACVSLAVIFLLSPVAALGSDTDAKAESYEPAANLLAYDWNLNQVQRPLLSLPERLESGIEKTLAYPMGQFRFPLFQSLSLDERSGHYYFSVVSMASDRSLTLSEVIELQQVGPSDASSSNSSGLYLSDNKGVKTVRTNDGSEYTFVRFSDNTIKCIRIKPSNGPIVTLVYTRENIIHAIVDSLGRMIKFNYEDHLIESITQTWFANSIEVSRTWVVRNSDQPLHAHAGSASKAFSEKSGKILPNNARTRQYTSEMSDSDKLLARIFGGPDAVARANGFEPERLAKQYPLYRGDLTADDGRVIRGHLSYAMHLYGNVQGTGDSVLYVPAGFTSHSTEPGPTDAAVTFYYPQLGNLTNVTLAVFHVANFKIVNEGGRVRIGDIGGAGGSFALYKHSHIEFYHGNTGLPAADARPALRIDPASVFGSNSRTASRARTTSSRRTE